MVVDRLILAASLALGLTVAGSALAQEPAKPTAPADQPAGKPDFATLDKNHHRYLLRSDIPHSMKHLRLHFTEADYNHDGRLSEPEYADANSDFPDTNLITSQQRAREGSLGRRQSERLNLRPTPSHQ